MGMDDVLVTHYEAPNLSRFFFSFSLLSFDGGEKGGAAAYVFLGGVSMHMS